MIDTKHYEILENFGYENKSEAYDVIAVRYAEMKGVTIYPDGGLYYIVQSKTIRNL